MTAGAAWIGLGSNQGDAVAACREAVVRLSQDPELEVVARSSLYRTEPVGDMVQPWYINAVIAIITRRSPERLLELLLATEAALGRCRHQETRWGPRVLDLDLLGYGATCCHTPALTLPHPRMLERRFVLTPLAEIAPHWIHPQCGKTIDSLLESLNDKSRVELFMAFEKP